MNTTSKMNRLRKLTFKRYTLDRITPEHRQQMRVDFTKMLPAGTDVEAILASQLHKAANDIIWTSKEFQVNVDGVSGHLSIKRHDKSPIDNRDDMLAIAAHFTKAKKMVPIELYPTDKKVIDTSNQYHVWAQIMKRHAVEQITRVLIENPDQITDLGNGYQGLMMACGEKRDWRAVQHMKNQRFGESREAFDLLLPLTAGLGVMLIVLPEGMTNPTGWQKGIRTDVEVSASG
jgi:hypothetical protein